MAFFWERKTRKFIGGIMLVHGSFTVGVSEQFFTYMVYVDIDEGAGSVFHPP